MRLSEAFNIASDYYLLNEAYLLEDIDAVRKQYSYVPKEDFDKIIRIDPTFDENRDSVGKYGKWLLGLYKKDNPLDNPEDFNYFLKDFDEKKNSREWKIDNDINKNKSLQDLMNTCEDATNAELTNRQKQRGSKNGYEMVHDDGEWAIFKILNHAGAIKLGKGSGWCTADSRTDYYNQYLKQGGSYYVIMNEGDHRDKYQVHFETGQLFASGDGGSEFAIYGWDEFFDERPGVREYFEDLGYDCSGPYNNITLNEEEIMGWVESCFDSNISLHNDNLVRMNSDLFGWTEELCSSFTGYSLDEDDWIDALTPTVRKKILAQAGLGEDYVSVIDIPAFLSVFEEGSTDEFFDDSFMVGLVESMFDGKLKELGISYGGPTLSYPLKADIDSDWVNGYAESVLDNERRVVYENPGFQPDVHEVKEFIWSDLSGIASYELNLETFDDETEMLYFYEQGNTLQNVKVDPIDDIFKYIINYCLDNNVFASELFKDKLYQWILNNTGEVVDDEWFETNKKK